LAPQLSMTVDLQSLGDATLSKTAIYLPFLLPHAIPDLHDPSTHSFLPNQRIQLIPAFRSLGVSTLKYRFSHMTIFRSGRSIDTYLPKSTTNISSVSLAFGTFNSQTLISSIHQSSGVDDLQTPVLLNQRLCLYFGYFTSQLHQWSCVPFLNQ
jgi:hypothetical protein